MSDSRAQAIALIGKKRDIDKAGIMTIIGPPEGLHGHVCGAYRTEGGISPALTTDELEAALTELEEPKSSEVHAKYNPENSAAVEEVSSFEELYGKPETPTAPAPVQQSPVQQAPVQRAPSSKPKIKVIYEGVFGKIRSIAEAVIFGTDCIIVRYDLEGNMCEPPISFNDPLKLIIGKSSYNVVHTGLTFEENGYLNIIHPIIVEPENDK